MTIHLKMFMTWAFWIVPDKRADTTARVVYVENDVVPPPDVAPPEDGLQHRIYLLKLNVAGLEAAGAPGRVPMVLEYPTKALRSTGIHVYMQGVTRGFQDLDAVP